MHASVFLQILHHLLNESIYIDFVYVTVVENTSLIHCIFLTQKNVHNWLYFSLVRISCYKSIPSHHILYTKIFEYFPSFPQSTTFGICSEKGSAHVHVSCDQILPNHILVDLSCLAQILLFSTCFYEV